MCSTRQDKTGYDRQTDSKAEQTETDRQCQMQVCFVARLSQRECVGNVVKCE